MLVVEEGCGAGGEANPQPTTAVMRNYNRLLLGLHVGVRRKVGCYLWWLWEATSYCSRGGGCSVVRVREEKGGEGGKGGCCCWCFCGVVQRLVAAQLLTGGARGEERKKEKEG